MAVIAIVETTENNRGRFLSESVETALAELATRYPVGASVADRLRRGERVKTDSYTLAIVNLADGREKKQRSLF